MLLCTAQTQQPKRNPSLRDVEALLGVLEDAWMRDIKENPPQNISREQLQVDIAALNLVVKPTLEFLQSLVVAYTKSDGKRLSDQYMQVLAGHFARVRAAIEKAAGNYPDLSDAVAEY
ncbi:MAG: hypothetical protein M1829_006204 [Trizodia sp. TS-e1964]|nr:MAG: hypothetical protein M1829_006204 [Trizodia sp. TS-e1964]